MGQHSNETVNAADAQSNTADSTSFEHQTDPNSPEFDSNCHQQQQQLQSAPALLISVSDSSMLDVQQAAPAADGPAANRSVKQKTFAMNSAAREVEFTHSPVAAASESTSRNSSNTNFISKGPETAAATTTTTAATTTSTNAMLSSTIIHAVSRGCNSAAICLTKAQKRASDLLTSAAGFLAGPLAAALAAEGRTFLDIAALVDRGVPVVVVMGQIYRVDRHEDKVAFIEDYYSRIIFTSRRNFVPIDFVLSPRFMPRNAPDNIAESNFASNDGEFQLSGQNDATERAAAAATENCLQTEQPEGNFSSNLGVTTETENDGKNLPFLNSPKNQRTESATEPTPIEEDKTESPKRSDSRNSDPAQPDENNHNHSHQYYNKYNNNMNRSPTPIPFIQRVLSRNKAGQIISDAGWGSMVRVTQMAVAQTLLTLRLGRGWRCRRKRISSILCNNNSDKTETVDNSSELPQANSSPEHQFSFRSQQPALEHYHHQICSNPISVSNLVPVKETTTPLFPPSAASRSSPSLPHHNQSDLIPSFRPTPALTELLSLFADYPESPLSVHSIARLGALHFGIPLGTWLGPTSCAQAVTLLMTNSKSQYFSDITPVVFPDGLLIHSAVRSLFQQSPSHSSKPPAVLIILCMRLGSDRFNSERYRAPLARSFRLDQFQGLAGGGSLTSAHFFFGTCARGLLYLDPHIAVQPAFLPDNNNLLQTSRQQQQPSAAAAAPSNLASFPDQSRLCSVVSTQTSSGAAGNSTAGVNSSLGELNRPNHSSVPDQQGSNGHHSNASVGLVGHNTESSRMTESEDLPNTANKEAARITENTDCRFSSDSSNPDVSHCPNDSRCPNNSRCAKCSPPHVLSLNLCDEAEYEHFILPYEVQFFPLVEQTYHSGPAVLPWSAVNPSMALYFLCQTLDEYQNLIDGLKVASENTPELFEMRETPLDFSKAAEIDVNQFHFDDDQEFGSD